MYLYMYMYTHTHRCVCGRCNKRGGGVRSIPTNQLRPGEKKRIKYRRFLQLWQACGLLKCLMGHTFADVWKRVLSSTC